MFSKPSILTRIATGKLIGLLIGVALFFAAPTFGIDDLKMRIGLLFWYAAIGACIALAGVLTWHPLLKIRLPWWCMGPAIGAWMNFLLILFTWNIFAPLMADGGFYGFTSPWWAVAEGAIVGFVISGAATWLGGEGPETLRVIERK